jgi:hypothetical protein
VSSARRTDRRPQPARDGDQRQTAGRRADQCGGRAGARLIGGKGNDRLEGAAGDDRFVSEPGADVYLLGGAGDDWLACGAQERRALREARPRSARLTTGQLHAGRFNLAMRP